MTLRPTSFVALLLLLALAVGCGSSKSTSTDAGPLPTDQCTNGSDLGIIEGLVSMTDAGLPDGGVPDGGPYPYIYERSLNDTLRPCTEEMCLPAFLTSPEAAEACVASCLETTAAAGLSEGCLACQLELVPCITENGCITACLGDDRAVCDACIIQFCGERLAACTGIEVPF